MMFFSIPCTCCARPVQLWAAQDGGHAQGEFTGGRIYFVKHEPGEIRIEPNGAETHYHPPCDCGGIRTDDTNTDNYWCMSCRSCIKHCHCGGLAQQEERAEEQTEEIMRRPGRRNIQLDTPQETEGVVATIDVAREETTRTEISLHIFVEHLDDGRFNVLINGDIDERVISDRIHSGVRQAVSEWLSRNGL